jgi:hypothetical protein
MNDSAKHKHYRFMLGTFVTVVVVLGIQILLKATYILLIYSTQGAFSQYGWGNVPPENLSAFIWFSEHLEAMLLAGFVLVTPAILLLVYRAAKTLSILEVKQNFGPGLTVLSLFIPFYSFYRPWAGLGEVRNTLLDTLREHRAPEAGITGANGETVIYAIALFAYMAFEKIVGRMAEGLVPKEEIKNGTEFNIYLEGVSNLFLTEIAVSTTFLLVLVWYWTSFLKLIKNVFSSERVSRSLEGEWSEADKEQFERLMREQRS